MKLTILGTGHAGALECYNSCFILDDDGKLLLVDTGGGNVLLKQLRRAGYSLQDIHHIFITHRHMDHIGGLFWVLRMVLSSMSRGRYPGELYIYSHREVINILQKTIPLLFSEKEARMVGGPLHLVQVEDGETLNVIGHDMTFFDIQSSKAAQFGFTLYLDDGGRFTCCGDEPFHECERQYVKDSRWLLHEAFCLYSHRDVFKHYEKSHSTARDACVLARQLNVENLVLFHTEDSDLEHRKQLYTEEGKEYFSGNLFVPDDLDTIEI